MQTLWCNGFMPSSNDFFRMRDELDRAFDFGLPLSNIRSVPRGTFPAVNMHEGKDAVLIDAHLPGIDPKAVDLTLADNALTIKGKRETGPEDEKPQYHRRERYAGEFSRILSLPVGIDANKINAHYRDGILTIRIAKAEEKKPKQIAITAG